MPRWTGWYRLTGRSPWQKAAEADTLDECARKLSEATRGLKLSNGEERAAAEVTPRPRRARQGERQGSLFDGVVGWDDEEDSPRSGANARR
jgi:hypothetical protein